MYSRAEMKLSWKSWVLKSRCGKHNTQRQKKSVLATPLLMPPILYFWEMSGFEPRELPKKKCLWKEELWQRWWWNQLKVITPWRINFRTCAGKHWRNNVPTLKHYSKHFLPLKKIFQMVTKTKARGAAPIGEKLWLNISCYCHFPNTPPPPHPHTMLPKWG
jgi:hypothetical protein